MLADAVPALACPVCHEALTGEGDGPRGGPARLRCAAGHTYDVARQGHVSLLSGRHTHTGDDAAMVGHRVDFLAAGHYSPIADALTAAVAAHAPREGLLLDIGGGPGWYSGRLLEADRTRLGVTFDASSAAARRAAKAHPRLASVVADGWAGYPLRDATVGVATCVFAPRNGAETARVLRPDGVLVVVTPLPDHLDGARELLGLIGVDAAKEERLEASLAGFERVDRTEVRRPLTLDAADLRRLALMGPSAHHLDLEALDAALSSAALPLPVSCAVAVGVYRARGPRP